MTSSPLIVTIDGQASSGKSSVAKQVAQKWQLRWLSSGKLYRMAGLIAHQHQFLPQHGQDFNDPHYRHQVTQLITKLRQDLVIDSQGHFILNGVNTTKDLELEQTGKHASFVARDPHCRKLLGAWLRDMAKQWQQNHHIKGMIFEGRDMGTIVFRDAHIKFFLTCDLLTKATRRWNELHPHQKPSLADLDRLRDLLRKRDSRDIHRKVAPLKPADDAITIDTTHKNLYDVVEIVSDHLKGLFNTSC